MLPKRKEDDGGAPPKKKPPQIVCCPILHSALSPLGIRENEKKRT